MNENQIDAIKNNDLDELKANFKTSADCNALSEDGIPALMLAAEKKSADAVKFLLEKGADINFALKSDDEDINGKTAIDIAIDKDDSETIEAFLFGKPGKSIANKILCYASTPQNLEKTIAFGADINAAVCDEQPLLISVLERNDSLSLDVLLKNAANVNIKDNEGMPAVFYSQPGSLKKLIKSKVDLTATYKNKTIIQDFIDTYISFFSNGYELDNVRVLLENNYEAPKTIDGKTISEYVKTKMYEKPSSPSMKITVDETRDKVRFEKKKEEVLEFLKSRDIN